MQLKLTHEPVQILGERIIVVTACRLARLTETPAVVGDYTISRVEQDRELFLPRCTAQWITMDQYDRLTCTMILVVEINIPGILHPNIDEVLKPRCNTGQ